MSTTDPVSTTRAAIWPRRIRFVHLGSHRIRIDMWAVAVTVILAVAIVAVSLWSLTLGSVEGANLSLDRVADALFGNESAAVNRIVVEGRLPRVLVAIVAGMALALSGAVFQTITRNPLGSPDIIGFTNGANTGALLAMLTFGLGYSGATIGAVVGGLGTGLLIYLLTWGQGLQGNRLVVIGIGISAMLVAFNSFLLVNSSVENAAVAAAWGQGIFDQLAMTDIIPVAVALVLLVPMLAYLSPSMRMFELGTDSAESKGVDTEKTQLLLLGIAVCLVSVVTAVAGPIAFIALIAPQVAARLTRGPGIPLVTSAAVGAALLVLSDAIARTLLAPTQLPVGVVTTALGGVYLVGLLLAQSRKAAS